MGICTRIPNSQNELQKSSENRENLKNARLFGGKFQVQGQITIQIDFLPRDKACFNCLEGFKVSEEAKNMF